MQHATHARKLACAPYSKFRMGTSVITDQGEIVRGTLVENVSLGLAMRAERSALFASVANAEGTPAVLAIASPKTSGTLTWHKRCLPAGCFGTGRQQLASRRIGWKNNRNQTAG